ncbi:DNA-directed RNA polymerase subunit alpha C-terminal domain-containing protein [Blautia sp.]|jgi:hypothetical protein|uniref:DNA-directed RNA polymerase subunit alpha C-terminal domain-containing protein n=1 Tax=Blautia sp. TaxID=1955243 RepID=UPI003D92AC6C
MKIRELDISARAMMCLLTAGYEDIEDLESITDKELLNIRNLNGKGVKEIRAAIDEYFASADESEDDEDEFEDITIFHDNGEIEVTVDFCGLEFNEYAKTITISIWANSSSGSTYKMWVKDLYINGTQHKQFDCIGSVADYGSDYLEEEIYNIDGVDYEDIRNIKFLVEIDDEDDNELANSKVVTLSCNVDNETFSVENIEDYEEDVDIIEDGENYLDPRDIPLDELGLSLSDQDDPFSFMASYPDTVKDIARKKEEAWEYRLFIEAAIYKYDSLISYRKQRLVFWEHENCLICIESAWGFTNFIYMQLTKLQDFMQNIVSCMNGDINESFGAPGEAGDVRKIIVATEKLMQMYKDMIAWKLSFRDIDADHMYRKVIEQFCLIIDSVLENIDVLYDKLHEAKKQFEDLLAGRITGEDLHVELNISFELKTEDFAKALAEWEEEYFGEESEEDEEDVIDKEIEEREPTVEDLRAALCQVLGWDS